MEAAATENNTVVVTVPRNERNDIDFMEIMTVVVVTYGMVVGMSRSPAARMQSTSANLPAVSAVRHGLATDRRM